MLTGFMVINSTYNGLDAAQLLCFFPPAFNNLGIYYLLMWCN